MPYIVIESGVKMNKLFACAIAVSCVLSLSGYACGQDILVNPQNQKYLFTAGTDETQAFLYNPAYLGLYSRGSVLDAYYFYPSTGQLNPSKQTFYDFGAFLQGGKFGVSFRNAATSSEDLNQYSIGLGLGDPRLAVGLSVSLMNITGLGSRWFPGVGIIWRPNPYVSFGAAYHNFSKRNFGPHAIEEAASFGVSVRPLGTSYLTLSGDLFSPIHNDGYKLGAAVEVLPGLSVFGIYDRSGYSLPLPLMIPDRQNGPFPVSMLGTNIAIGVSFNLGSHVHAEGASSYRSGGYAATYSRVMFASQDMSTILLGHRVAEITIRGNLQDAKEQSFFFLKANKPLLEYIEEIKKCGDDLSIAALILKIYPFSTSDKFFSLSGETQELADAVRYVRDKGKKVYAYLMDDSGVDELYLASAADKIYMAPVAFISGYGVNMDLIRMKGLFDKLHISWNAQTAGKFKSTFHTIYTDSATPEQAKLIQGLADDIYTQMLKQIEVSRGITLPDSVKSAVSGILSSEDAAAVHVIDGAEYYDEFKKDVDKDLYGLASASGAIDPANLHRYESAWGKEPEIAVIGVYGSIVTGPSSAPGPFPIPFLGSGRTSGSETVAAQINAAASNSDIKAIVLRVNSGGGSALASDQIYRALTEAASKKPVVASFGNVAASGGYYVAAGAKRIFAEPASVTGSIGVVIFFPVLTDFLEKDLGTNVEQYRAGENSDLLSPFHRWNDQDLKYIDAFLNQTYMDFKEKVAAGRKLALERVEELAQGKVYTGDQAKSLNLVDEFGGLDKAIQYAARSAGVSGEYQIKMFTVPGIGFGDYLGLGIDILQIMSDWKLYD